MLPKAVYLQSKMTNKFEFHYVFDLIERCNCWLYDPHKLLGHIPDEEIPLINEQIKVCTGLKPGESRILDHRLVTGNSNQPVLVRDEWHYHCGDSDRCQKIYGVATLLKAKTSHISRMSQEQRESQYSLLVQCLLDGRMQLIESPEDKAVLRVAFPQGVPRGALNEIHPFFFESNPFTEAVEIWLPGQLRPVNTIRREISGSLYIATRDFCQMSQKRGYRKLSYKKILDELSEAAEQKQPMSVIRHEDNIGLWTVNNQRRSGIPDIQFTARDMLDGWDYDEHRIFREIVETRGYLDTHRWRAFDLTKERNRIELEAEIEMVFIDDILCRIVKGQSYRLLG